MIMVECRAPMRAMLAPVRSGLIVAVPAPEIVAAEAERSLVRIELRPHRRMHAVAGDQQVGLLRGQR
jgi:hypothetical protein